MPKRLNPREQLALEIETLTDLEAEAVLEYITLTESARTTVANATAWDDELVAVLSNARENRRARQAFAWEAVRRRTDRRSNLTGLRSS